MSIYTSSSSANCGGDQSPINLSQSISKPCDLLCECVVDKAMISQANVMISDEGLILQNTASLGSCKYNTEGYTCNALIVNHPSHHTIENIQADGEVVAVFSNPTGKYVCVSSLFRVNSSESSSTHFFDSFIPYANPTEKYVSVNLGDNWNLSMMAPPTKGYYVYDGSMPWNCNQPTKWVVYKAMINMSPTTFALLTKNVAPGSRSVQPLGSREVFFNEGQDTGGYPTAGGEKTYLKFKFIDRTKKDAKNVEASPLKENASKNNKNFVDKIIDSLTKGIETNGTMYYVSMVLTFIAFLIGVYAGMNMSFVGTYILNFFQDLPGYIYTAFMFVYNNTIGRIIPFLIKKPDQPDLSD